MNEKLDFEVFIPKWWNKNPHLQTILPHLFRKLKPINYKRKRLELQDGDFVDLDFSQVGAKKLCLVLHGLESSSKRGYIYGIVNALNEQNFDVCVMNFRACSGETNRMLKAYHSGKTEDLKEVFNYLQSIDYQLCNIVGVSLGGNVLLKFLGEITDDFSRKINKAIAISVPLDLKSTSDKLAQKSNKIYHDRFLKSLKEKVQQKEQKFKDQYDFSSVYQSKTIKEFDENFTAPVNGFASADAYYAQNSSLPFLSKIRNKTLIISSLDDPFLAQKCFPNEKEIGNTNIQTIYTKAGGHVGFLSNLRDKNYWHEAQMIRFFGK
jgi:uncharacterized protein